MRKVYPAKYCDLQYQLDEVKQLVMLVFEYLGEGADVASGKTPMSASAYFCDVMKYRAVLSACMSLICEMMDEVEVRLETGCEE